MYKTIDNDLNEFYNESIYDLDLNELKVETTTNPSITRLESTNSNITFNDGEVTFNDGSVSIDVPLYVTTTNAIAYLVRDTGGSPIFQVDTSANVVQTFGQLTVDGALVNNDTTDSTLTTNGAITTDGGIGIAKTANIGGRLVVNDVTNSTSSTTGACVVSGGLGIAKDIYIGSGFTGFLPRLRSPQLNGTSSPNLVEVESNGDDSQWLRFRHGGGAGIRRAGVIFSHFENYSYFVRCEDTEYIIEYTTANPRTSFPTWGGSEVFKLDGSALTLSTICDMYNGDGVQLKWDSADYTPVIGDGTNDCTGLTGNVHALTNTFTAHASDWCMGTMQLAWTGKGTVSGNIVVELGTPVSAAGHDVAISIGYSNGISIGGASHLTGTIASGTSHIYLWANPGNGSAPSRITDTDLSTAGSLNISFQYPVVKR